MMEAVLSGWTLMAKFKEFCSAKDLAPFSKDLWTQIGRFAHLVRRLPGSLAPWPNAAHMRGACHARALGPQPSVALCLADDDGAD